MEIVLSLVLFFSGGWLGYGYGKDVQAEQCRDGIYQLQTIIDERNKEVLADQVEEQQKFEEALRMQSIKVIEINSSYQRALEKIEEVDNEVKSTSCGYAPVDYDELNRLREDH